MVALPVGMESKPRAQLSKSKTLDGIAIGRSGYCKSKSRPFEVAGIECGFASDINVFIKLNRTNRKKVVYTFNRFKYKKKAAQEI